MNAADELAYCYFRQDQNIKARAKELLKSNYDFIAEYRHFMILVEKKDSTQSSSLSSKGVKSTSITLARTTIPLRVL